MDGINLETTHSPAAGFLLDAPSPKGLAPLRTLLSEGTLTGLTDADLLARYRDGGEAVAEAAFSAMVERHGPMVLHVCRAVLGNSHDAEDAFQATFLVLARRAGAIRRGDRLASWLYAVARRLSLRSRGRLARRREAEQRRASEAGLLTTSPASPLAPEIFEELDRLPAAFRAAVVLCDLEGQSYERAAALLRCPLGTLQSRLARGRNRLRDRLTRRGLAPALIPGGPLFNGSLSTLPPTLAASTVRAALSAGGIGGTAAAPLSSTIVSLAAGELNRRLLGRSIQAAVMGLAVMFTAALAGAFALSTIPPAVEPPKPPVPPAHAPRPIPTTPEAESPEKKDGPPIHVRTIDAQGKPVSDVTVEMVRAETLSVDPHGMMAGTFEKFTTDAQGTLSIPSVRYGSFLLMARGKDGSLGCKAHVNGYMPMERDWFHINESTPEHPVVLELSPMNRRVEGKVVDPSGKPIAGARVMVRGLGKRYHRPGEPAERTHWVPLIFEEPPFTFLPQTVTDANGRYELTLPEGATTRLGATHPDYTGPDVVGGKDAKMFDPIVLEPHGSISAQVVNAATGKPLAGALVGVRAYDLRMLGYADRHNFHSATARTDAEGKAAFGDLSPGIYLLYLKEVEGQPRLTALPINNLRVEPGKNTSAALNVTEGWPISGIVVDRDTDKPIPNLKIQYTSPATPHVGDQYAYVPVEFDGRFRIYAPPGNVMLSINDERKEYFTKDLIRFDVVEKTAIIDLKVIADRVPESKPEPPKAEAAPRVDHPSVDSDQIDELWKLWPDENRPVVTLSGRVVDPEGRPITDMHFFSSYTLGGSHMINPNFLYWTTTDGEGRFVLRGMTGRPPRLYLEKGGFQGHLVDVPSEGDDVTLIYQMTPDPSREKSMETFQRSKPSLTRVPYTPGR